ATATIALLVVSLPAVIRKVLVTRAADCGIALTIGGVDLGLSRLHLTDVRAMLLDVPGVGAMAAGVDIDLRRFAVRRILAHDVDATVDGSYADLTTAVARWRLAYGAADDGVLESVDVDAAHVRWTRALGDRTALDASGIHARVARTGGQPLGGD